MDSELKYAGSVIAGTTGGLLITLGIQELLPSFTPQLQIIAGVLVLLVSIKVGLVNGKVK